MSLDGSQKQKQSFVNFFRRNMTIALLYSLLFLSEGWFLSAAEYPHHHRLRRPNSINIFILAGQSNMSGRGGVINGTWDGVVPPECRQNPSVLRFSGTRNWVVAEEPLHKDIDVNKTCGISPGLAFANSLLFSNSKSNLGIIGLVPCAIGGTNISQWARGTYLYNRLMSRTTAALKGGGSRGGASLRALLWYQGESDTINLEDAQLYKNRLIQFFTNVRRDLNSPTLPIIQVALASGEGPYVEEVRRAQMGIELPAVKCIDAKGLEMEPDNLHLTARAEVRLGEMFAHAFLQIRPRE